MLAIEAPFPQFFDTDGSPMDAGQLFFGVANQNPETSPITVYWDAAATQPADQPIPTLNGYAVRNGTPTSIFVNGDYSLNARNSRGNLIFYAPTSNSGSIDGTLVRTVDAITAVNATGLQDGTVVFARGRSAVGDGGGGVFRYVSGSSQTVDSGTVFAPSTGSGRLFRDGWTVFGFNGRVSAKWFGAKGDGSTNDSAAIQLALDSFGATDTKIGAGLPSAEEGKGGEVFLPQGLYVATNLKIKNGVYLIGEGRLNTIIIPPAASTGYAVKIIGSHGGLKDVTLYNKNAVASMTGYGIVPDDETQTTVVKEQNYNTVENVYVLGFANGSIMRCGPDVGGTDSGCWYNNIFHVTISQCDRALWLREGQNAGASGANRNNFVNCRFGQNACSVGVWNDDANTNMFVNCSFEGIGTAGILATPTGIYMPNSTGPTSGSSASLNKFINCEMEAVTRAYSIATGLEWMWVGGDLGSTGTGQGPDVWIDVKRTKFNHGVEVQAAPPVTPATHTVYNNNIVTSWIKFDGRGASFGTLGAFNCTVARVGAGEYTVTFIGAMASANSYTAQATCEDGNAECSGYAAGSFTVKVKDYAGTQVDSARVSVMTVGE